LSWVLTFLGFFVKLVPPREGEPELSPPRREEEPEPPTEELHGGSTAEQWPQWFRWHPSLVHQVNGGPRNGAGHSKKCSKAAKKKPNISDDDMNQILFYLIIYTYI
jgi:hypothetical protein